MIKLKTEVVKKHLIEQLKAEAELIYKDTWQPKLQERAFLDGAEAIFKLLRLGVSDSFCSHNMTRNPKEHQENKCRLCKKPYQK